MILIEIAVNTWFPNEKDYYKGHVVLLWDYYIKSPRIESLIDSPGNGYEMKLSDTGILALSEASLKAILNSSFQFIKGNLNQLFSSAVYPDQKRLVLLVDTLKIPSYSFLVDYLNLMISMLFTLSCHGSWKLKNGFEIHMKLSKYLKPLWCISGKTYHQSTMNCTTS